MAALVRKLSQIGNSKGIILPQTVLEMLNWDSDAEVELSRAYGSTHWLVKTTYKMNHLQLKGRTQGGIFKRQRNRSYLSITVLYAEMPKKPWSQTCTAIQKFARLCPTTGLKFYYL